MTNERWRTGDVVLWVESGAGRAGAEVFFEFYDGHQNPLGWVEVFVRPGPGVEDAGCAYLGNMMQRSWLRGLLDQAELLGIRMGSGAGAREWRLERVTLDFRLGEDAGLPVMRCWDIEGAITPGYPEVLFPCRSYFNPGFERELETRAGEPRALDGDDADG